MDKLTVAEHLLTPITGHARATEIVGDLLEANPSATAFWFSITRIALAYTWRWLVAIPVAMFSVLLALKPYAIFVVEPWVRQIDRDVKPMHYGVQPAPLAMQIGGAIAIIGMCLWTVAALTLIRYGVRSALTRLSCLLSVVFTVGACAIEQPHAVIAAPVLLMASTGVVLMYAPSRRPLACIVAAGASFFFGFLVLGVMMDFGLTHLRSSGKLLVFTGFGAYVASFAMESVVLSRIRRWLHVE